MYDEGPSAEDLDRFGGDDEGGDTGYCPVCGAEIWDQTPQCPQCRAYVAGDVRSRPPTEAWFRRRWMLLVVILVLIAFVLVFVL